MIFRDSTTELLRHAFNLFFRYRKQKPPPKKTIGKKLIPRQTMNSYIKRNTWRKAKEETGTALSPTYNKKQALSMPVSIFQLYMPKLFY
ncbi:MAG: hypothetical protein A3H69_02310 [Candidatus Sungbacteria bacterium RIFCSPLOWO2_02_FULL_47_9]|nr:MAG: hypothetical protein A3A28_04310 [Candidatus Sungbacteria bacterium RIFCSPLOWO2_01_FULL_47_32]OHA11527.1 MAG: hypothetical protein A3H69_02310 [Candidatus Sungbacteria bacterium RIFCSPLOWO2_02_FULL_47_9]